MIGEDPERYITEPLSENKYCLLHPGTRSTRLRRLSECLQRRDFAGCLIPTARSWHPRFLTDTGPELLFCLLGSASARYKPLCSDSGHPRGFYSEWRPARRRGKSSPAGAIAFYHIEYRSEHAAILSVTPKNRVQDGNDVT